MNTPPPQQPTLESIANEIRTFDLNTASRLEQLGQAVDYGILAEAWAAANIHQLIDPAGVAERRRVVPNTSKWLASTARWVSYLEWARNFLVLTPLVVTWLGIAVAVAGYQALLKDYPSDAFLPFLSLWQDGFGGHLLWDLTLSKVAIIDFSILTLVIIITAIVSWHNHVSLGKAEQKADEAETSARQLNADLHDILANASLGLASRMQGQTNNFVPNLADAVGRLLTQLEAERAHLNKLVADKENELKKLATITPSLADVSTKIAEATTALGGATTSLTTTLTNANQELKGIIGSLVTPAQELSNQQKQWLPLAQGAVTHLGALSAGQGEFTARQEELGRNFGHAFNILNQTMNQSIDAAKQMGLSIDQHAQFLQKLEADLASQATLSSQVGAATTGLTQALESIKLCELSLRGLAGEMNELANRMVALPEALNNNLFGVLKEYSLAASKIGSAGDQLATIPGQVDQWMRHWDSRNNHR
ncbi:MAG TPA: hypothetical protein VFV38_14270 [Ktedonobacteraceae bacterium]|nr:hypothetical protein [Ktedonobacteraceae bacterium]